MNGSQNLRTLLRLDGEHPCPADGNLHRLILSEYERGYVANWRAPSPISSCRLKAVELLKNSASPQHEYILAVVVDSNDHTVGYIRLERTDVSRSVLSPTRCRSPASSTSHSSSDLPPAVHRISIYNDEPPRDGARVVYSYTWLDAGRRPSLVELAAVVVAIHEDKQCYWYAGMLMYAIVGEDVKGLVSSAAVQYPDNEQGGRIMVKANKAGTFATLFRIVTTQDISAEHARLEPALKAKKTAFHEQLAAYRHDLLHRVQFERTSPEDLERLQDEFKSRDETRVSG
ncbi:hypothetical protein OH76DRAFT_1397886 [Lentinus brumalis]|uniref:Uncharacterized protein n=1 Tax=Lentinus brumalis TaxID=2498619 RepID=A0A371DPV9_9APHY|nr:hypothetical protein OH76DRAFT_1397886 [Polyporus brumalis]